MEHRNGGNSDERKKIQFDVESMKIIWAGSREAFDISDRMSKLVANDPAFRKDTRTMLVRKELFENTLRKAAYAWKLITERNLSPEEANKLRFFVDEPASSLGFIVRLRSLEDHSPLLGITVGDIGMKIGNGAYNTMDNGVLRFDYVLIPRNQCLCGCN